MIWIYAKICFGNVTIIIIVIYFPYSSTVSKPPLSALVSSLFSSSSSSLLDDGNSLHVDPFYRNLFKLFSLIITFLCNLLHCVKFFNHVHVFCLFTLKSFQKFEFFGSVNFCTTNTGKSVAINSNFLINNCTSCSRFITFPL